jgi:hypothetical protein
MDLSNFLNETTMLASRFLFSGDYELRRDPGIEIADYVLDVAGSELGFFFVLMLGCIFILLNQVGGNLFRLKIFLMNRDFHLV